MHLVIIFVVCNGVPVFFKISFWLVYLEAWSSRSFLKKFKLFMAHPRNLSKISLIRNKHSLKRTLLITALVIKPNNVSVSNRKMDQVQIQVIKLQSF